MTKTVTRYRHVLDISDARVGDVDAIVDLLRGVAYPVLDMAAQEITITYEVGEDGIEDLWELRDVIAELESNLTSYLALTSLGKPALVDARED